MVRVIILFCAVALIASCGRGRDSVDTDPDAVRAKFGFASTIQPICGSKEILGERIDPGGQNASNPRCGFSNAVRVYAVSGVALSPPARMTCRTADRAEPWISDYAQPAVQDLGETLLRAHVAADYSCRTRNHQRNAPLSEHAKGTAIDFGSFSFESGKRLTVEDNWRGRDSKIMRAIFRAGCRVWSTSIGPDGDRFHQDHFHFDAARAYGPGGYCE